jgi:hypothetical protein
MGPGLVPALALHSYSAKALSDLLHVRPAEIGTTVDIYLPVSQAEAVPILDPHPPVSGTLASGSGRILVLDDEESIRMMLQVMLPTLGYEVTCVTIQNELNCLFQIGKLRLCNLPNGFQVNTHVIMDQHIT